MWQVHPIEAMSLGKTIGTSFLEDDLLAYFQRRTESVGTEDVSSQTSGTDKYILEVAIIRLVHDVGLIVEFKNFRQVIDCYV